MKGNTAISGIIGSNWKRLFWIILLLWLIINEIQAVFTEIMSDEAYYSLYGENLAWGYFDHPPMVSVMTWFSSLLFGGNLSVRFLTVVFQTVTLVLIWKTIAVSEPGTKKILLFFTIAASPVMFQAYGFTTTPDVPFLLFTALFLFVYKQFLEKESVLNTLGLTVAMAGMMYSKYHAVLIIGLVVLSNLRLLSRTKFWLAGLGVILLLIPHIYWQIANDFPSFKYHLNDRSSHFRWGYFFEYLPNQLAVFNPFTFGAAVYVLIKYKPRDLFEKSLYFLIAGFILFFWVSSFRGHVEPHWTVACSIPMIILLFRRSLQNPALMRYVKYWIAPSILLILVARILLIAGCLPEKLDFSGKRQKAGVIEARAGDLPVVFTGSFQEASNYHFFTKKEAFVLSDINGRQTQFDLWQKELQYQGKAVYISQSPTEGRTANNFQSVNRIQIKYTLPKTEFSAGDTLHIPFTMYNPTGCAVDFRHPEFPVGLQAAYRPNIRKAPWIYAECRWSIPRNALLPAKAASKGILTTVVPNMPARDYQFTLTLVNSICAAKNSNYEAVHKPRHIVHPIGAVRKSR